MWLTSTPAITSVTVHHDTQYYPAPSAGTFVRLTHGWLHHFINHTPAITLPGWRVCCLAHYVVHTLPSPPAYWLLVPNTLVLTSMSSVLLSAVLAVGHFFHF